MIANMVNEFEVRGNTELELQVHDFTNSQRVDVFPTLSGREYQFVFTWNAKYGFFGIEVRDPRGRLDKWYPRPGHEHLLKDFNPNRRRQPDALISIIDTGGGEAPPKPDTMGTQHQVQVLTGQVIE